MPNRTSLPEPTGTSVSDLHERLLREWGPRFNIDETLREMIFASNPIETLPDSPARNMSPIEIHSGRPGGIIEHANGLLMAMPSFHAEPPSMLTDDVRDAESVERAVARLFERELLANDFWPSVGRDVLSYGRAFIKTMTSESEWTAQAGFPVRGDDETGRAFNKRVKKFKGGKEHFPFIIQHVPALSILPLLDNKDNVLATVEEKFVTAKVLAEDMKSPEVMALLTSGALKWYDQLPVVEYIDDEWVGYFLAGTEPSERDIEEDAYDRHQRNRAYSRLRAWRHGMGVHPVVMVPGMQTGEREYRLRWKSFLTDGKDSLQLYDFLLSRLTTMVWAYYLPSYIWRLAMTGAAWSGKDRPIQHVELGGVTTLYNDEALEVLPVPPDLPDALTLLERADDDIQKHTLEDVLFGRVQGAAPAFQVNLRINVAKSKLSTYTAHMATGITKVAERFFRGVEQLKKSVEIGGETVTVTMAKEYRKRVTASITPKSPVDRNQDIGVANMARDFGLPWDWIAEHILDIEDPATLRLLNDIRELEEAPEMKAILLQDAMQQLEMRIEEHDYMDMDDIDMSLLPDEFRPAIGDVLSAASGEEVSQPPMGDEVAPPGEGGGIPAEGYPEGSAPQTIQGGRGLLTENAQPQPGTAQPNTKEAVPGAF